MWHEQFKILPFDALARLRDGGLQMPSPLPKLAALRASAVMTLEKCDTRAGLSLGSEEFRDKNALVDEKPQGISRDISALYLYLAIYLNALQTAAVLRFDVCF